MRGKNYRRQNTEGERQKFTFCSLFSVLWLWFSALCSLFCVCLFFFTYAFAGLALSLSIGCQSPQITELSSLPLEQREAYLRELLDKKFENPDVHYQLGQLYQSQGKWAKAEYHYNVALNFNPAHRAAQAAMVKGLLDNGEKAKAQQCAQNYMNQVKDSAIALLGLARAFDKQGLDDYALTCYQQALRIAPDSAEVNKQLGYYYLNNGDKTQAKDYLSRSFQLNPNQPDVAGELGRLGVVVRVPSRER